ncbi:PRP1 splicing factor, N-terminal-domain-containing protein [Mycena belliarum]|uniref:PRP1 splicing factor, N-terminal-domain-containing protein n=1 Tax=Mycena belliarum TaxID=1033014 RepID=A0AAD6UHJ8_9AGAR|nr:PRP1 splicing factor, N-terminal-domain-containing protein [Mycena belliae]
MASKNKDRLAFLTMPAPASYVAGLGRGASGFTTRSDIGPARDGPSAEAIAEAQARRGEEAEYDPDAFQDPESETGLFAGTIYEADDEEADQIFARVDGAMESRRKARREAREAKERQKARVDRPKIQEQFSDLKRGLSAVTDEEWGNLPEVGNLTKRRKVRETRSYVVPDSILVGDRNKLGHESSLSAQQQIVDKAGDITDFVELGNARDKVLSLRLDQASGAASGLSTSINPKDYLTDLNSVSVKSEAEIGDIKKARMLFDSMVKSNPKYAQGWIAAACVEEHAGRMVAARKLINAGCQQCPKSEEIWLEAARLHKNDDAKVILANAVNSLQQSVKIWLRAADLEADPNVKKRVLRKALDSIPHSVRLWKEAINLETSASDARLLLARAVEIIPQSVELWLALAKLGSSEHAKGVLNKARKAVPTSHEIWIAAAHLIEHEAQQNASHGSPGETIDRTILAAVRELRKHGVSFSRDQWITEAENSDDLSMPLTCEAIVKSTISMDVEPEDRIPTWLGDLESLQLKKRLTAARAVAAFMLKVFPNRVDVWEKAIELEGASSSSEALFEKAVGYCPQAEVFWLRWAKKKWLDGNVPGARQILEQAFLANPESENIWLAAVKLEAENGEQDVARALLIRAREVANTSRIWMKAAVFERQQGRPQEALAILQTALAKFPTFSKLYMIQGQIHENLGDHVASRASFTAGLKSCPKDPRLWILASRLEEKDGKSIKARSLLEKARLMIPGDETLWAEAVLVEERSNTFVSAKSVLARALQACPSSCHLWAISVWRESRPTRKSRAADAMSKSGKHPLVLCTVARLFWAERKIEKARDWFHRAVQAALEDSLDLGDIWAWWLRFEREYGTETRQQEVVSACIAAAPRHGEVWQPIAKALGNEAKSTADILNLVVDALDDR